MSDGYQTVNNRQRPKYLPAVAVRAQFQAMQYRDIMQVQGLNLQGTRRAVYLSGDVEGLLRASSRGGDLITRRDGTCWLVAMVLEVYSENGSNARWVKVAVTQQNQVSNDGMPPSPPPLS
ncbi:MAG: hypothetical protein KGO96_10665 [Elusimicrobia bacterium]|nr:hypothetical protein [Elusimicrobiota bacterium]